VQTLLGEINGCATVRRMVSSHQGDREILTALQRRQREKAREFRRHWTAANPSEEIRGPPNYPIAESPTKYVIRH
jgi:hypothetical protein